MDQLMKLRKGEERHLVMAKAPSAFIKANNATVQWLTESEQTFGIVGKQVNLKVGIVGGILLEGTHKGLQFV
ncbi:hypothetical protein TYRP_012868 [Tyrophagus putrescentiae]|nr:hypothetical protein TYRP_012868 [Tyrophagus putrescentiae]